MTSSRTLTRDLTLPGMIAAGAAGISLLARIEIPFVPVPFTLLTLGAMLAGVILGRQRGTGATLLWIVAGTAGLPVFAGGKLGPSVLFGPTGGYILALPLVVTGWSLVARRFSWSALLVAGASSVLHLLVGTLWLATFVGGERALAVGFLPFLGAEALKGAVAFAVSRIRG